MTPDLIAALSALLEQAQAWLAGGGLVFARVGPVFALAPVLGERAIPVRIRLVAALAMTAVVAPAVVGAVPVPQPAPIPVALFLMQETLVGLMLGLALRFLIMALQMAGTMAAQATSFSQAFGGAGVDPQPAIAHLLVVGGLALAAIAGLPERLAALLVLSYDLFPPGHWPTPSALATWGTTRVAHAFALAFSLAAPFVIGAGLYNLALGAINRAMPQLMVFFVGAPALTLGGLALLVLTAPLMFTLWAPALSAVLANPVAAP
ncbi:MAG: flagellar biosynthetic protein FliR [Rhodobacter sp.]|uniref:flagellar biosynthetic protein FliR n=1 Tax=Pararhodobacter sp. TaxID=2127056 RepID=UPI001D572340|nr:flagellar biosynthetic protein FliR [Pararhodobacter sp.]MCB1345758.1 flagellar biosynthetic protein FliR [Paracoccaceae bacterium]MCC0074427.1 flagellar biosynthetic protein FliR [Rhodobacter sp.]HPD91407.1 flagellar biosynthetic protein FliR [Pararhodobacter sp.]